MKETIETMRTKLLEIYEKGFFSDTTEKDIKNLSDWQVLQFVMAVTEAATCVKKWTWGP